MKAPVTVGIEDFLRIRSVSGLRYSPDGQRVACVVQEPDLQANGYRAGLLVWERRTGACREFDAGSIQPSFLWLDADRILHSAPVDSPDAAGTAAGRVATGASGQAGTGSAQTGFRTLNVVSGERTEGFVLPLRAKGIVRADDGAFIVLAVFASGQAPGAPRGDAIRDLVQGRDYEIVDHLPVWSDGAGFLRGQVNRLYSFREGGDPVPLTGEDMHVESFRARGTRVVFVGRRASDVLQSTGIFVHDLESGATDCLVPQDRYAVAHADFLGDSVVFAGVDRRGGLKTDNPKFYRIGDDGTPAIWAGSDLSVRDTVGYDCKYGESRGFKVSGDALYFVATRERSSFLTRIRRTGALETLTQDDGAVQDFDVLDGEAVFAGVRGMGLQELYLLDRSGERRLTGINDGALEGRTIVPARTMVFRNNGFDVHYVVLEPANFDPESKYPAVLYIHGGAKVLYGPVFFHEMQVLAARGFFVVYGNPRGSDGGGSEFARLKGRYGQLDYEDMMKAVDTALDRYPQIDPGRLAVAGGSYGGIMTNWTIGHTHRFRCAIADRSLCNMISAFGTADNGYDFVREQMDADPWSDLDLLWEQSPLKYAGNVRTPLLLVHSDQDYRCHHSEAVQFFTALRFFGVEARLLLVRGECHDLSRTGRPKQRILRLTEIVHWLERHLRDRDTGGEG